MEIKINHVPQHQIATSRPDWLLFFLLIAIAVVGASAFVIGYILLAAAP